MRDSMLRRASSALVDRLLAQGLLDSEKRDWYIYTVQKRTIHLINTIISISVFSMIWGFIPCASYLFAFLVVRKYAGGLHASTPIRCIVWSFVLTLCGMSFSTFLLRTDIFLLCFLIAGLSVWLVHANSKGGLSSFSEVERCINRRKALLASCLLAILAIVLILTSINEFMFMIGSYCCGGLFFASILTIPVKQKSIR